MRVARAFCVVCFVFCATLPLLGADLPIYHGLALDAQGKKLEGSVNVEVSFFQAGQEKALRQERIPEVRVHEGRFELKLGVGSAAETAPSLTELFKRFPELEMELSLNGIPQAPRVRIEPAGFSQADRAMLAGHQPKPGEKHWEGYRVPGNATAIQAVTLRPASSAAGAPSSANLETNPFLLEMISLGVSPAVRDLPKHPGADARPKLLEEDGEINPIRHEDLFDKEGRRYGTATTKIEDSLASRSRGTSGRDTPDPILNFPGIGNVDGVYPPDPEGAVGPNNYLQVVNLSFAIFDKSGNMISGPTSTNQLFAGASGACAADNSGDAIFLYDEQADRWVLTQFAVESGQAVCFAVSTTGDPTGTYYLYQLNTQRFPDYFKLGVWPDPQNNAYFMGTNTGYGGQYDVYAIDRASLLTNTAPRPAQYFQDHPNLLMPADLDGNNPPPEGSPGIFYTFRDGGESYFGSPPTDSLDIWEFHVDWDTPSNSTFGISQSFTPPDLADFNWTICGFFETDCLPQPGTSVGLDSGSWWPMQRLQYRNLGPYETLVGNWTVDVDGNGDHAGLRWFELRRPGSGPWSIEKQGTHAPDSIQRWEGSTALDGSGNMAIGFSVVSAPDTIYASIRYATRHRDADVFDAEKTLIAGSGYQTGSYNRWGDYASMEVDPADDCTFWFTTEYLDENGVTPWETRIGTFKIPGCSGSLGLGVTPGSTSLCASAGTTSYDIVLSDPFIATTNLSLSGCPAGAQCSFSTNPVVSPASTSSLDLSQLDAVSTGNYSITVTAVDSVDPGTQLDSSVRLNLFQAAPQAPVLTTPADGAQSQDTTLTLEWNGSSDVVTYHLQLADDAAFSNILVDRSGLSSTTSQVSSLQTNTTYYWRVIGANPCGTSNASATFSFTTAPAPGDCGGNSSVDVGFEEDFESGLGLWTHSGTGDTWALTQGEAHAGASSMHADDPSDISDQYLVSPPIVLVEGADSAALIFYSKQSIEDSYDGCYDGGLIEVSTDDGGSWTQLAPVVDPYDGSISSSYENPAAGKDAWCGDPEDWTKSVVMLSAYTGETIRLRFRMTSDSSTGYDGWWLDDIKVQSCLSGPADSIFIDGFEDGNTGRWSWSTDR